MGLLIMTCLAVLAIYAACYQKIRNSRRTRAARAFFHALMHPRASTNHKRAKLTMKGLFMKVLNWIRVEFESFADAVFAFACSMAIVGTIFIRLPDVTTAAPPENLILCLIPVTGFCYGLVLVSLSLSIGMLTYLCVQDLVPRAQLKNCFYGAGLAFCTLTTFFVVPLIVGTTAAVIAAATAFPLLVFGYFKNCSRLFHILWSLWRKVDSGAEHWKHRTYGH